MASNQTSNFQLSQWDANDEVLRADFNGDNLKIDAALTAVKEVTDVAFTPENSPVAIGWYQGNDAVKRKIELGFTPKAVIVCRLGYQMYFENGSRNGVGGGLALEGHPIDVEHSGWQPVEIVTNGFKVSTVISDSDDYAVANNYGDTYHFIAFKNGQIVEK